MWSQVPVTRRYDIPRIANENMELDRHNSGPITAMHGLGGASGYSTPALQLVVDHDTAYIAEWVPFNLGRFATFVPLASIVTYPGSVVRFWHLGVSACALCDQNSRCPCTWHISIFLVFFSNDAISQLLSHPILFRANKISREQLNERTMLSEKNSWPNALQYNKKH